MSRLTAQVRARRGRPTVIIGGLISVWSWQLSRMAHAADLSVFAPASPPAESIRNVFYLVLGIAAAILLLVEGLLLYCLLRFRRRPDDDAAEPPQMYGSVPIEVAWTVGPALIVFVLFLIVVRSVAELVPDKPPPDALEVTVVGHQWWWEYRYLAPHGDGQTEQVFTTANELHVPEGRTVFLHLESADVVHSFWVPRLSGKMDVVPGRVNDLWFIAQERGVFEGMCAEFCGTQHANMMIRVVAERPDEFDQWYQRQQEPAAEVPTAQAGKQAFLGLACVNCHTVRGTTARGKFGPDLTHLMSRQRLGSGVLANGSEEDVENLARWVSDPGAIKPGCLMPNMQLDADQLSRVVDYLATLQ